MTEKMRFKFHDPLGLFQLRFLTAFKVIGCHAHSNAHTHAIFKPTTDFDHLNFAEHSAEHD